VPLSDQDVHLWETSTIREAEALLTRAGEAGVMGRFQLEAAIQSIHAQRAMTGRTRWPEIAQLYEGLMRIAPTVGAAVGRAAAIAEAYSANTALALLREIPATSVKSYQPYWVVLAHALRMAGDGEAARAAQNRAIGLTEDPAIRRYLASQ
jgi:RNA polymerase sigma-70 factor (ECF subfamily)